MTHHHHVPRTVHCGSTCTAQPSQQYPGAGGQTPSVYIGGGGALPFTGLGFEGVALLLVALVLVAAGAVARWAA